MSSAKLAALVGAHLGERIPPEVPIGFPTGAALRLGSQAWVLNDRDNGRSLGPALAWAGRQGHIDELHLLVGSDAAHLARQAQAFHPEPRIWRIEGRELIAATPEPIAAVAELEPAVASCADLFTHAGARAVVEQDMLIAEVEGLEVARAFVVDDAVTVEIGVGRFDREAHQVISAERPTSETLQEVVQLVRRYRHPGAPPHPLNRLARERFARSMLIDSPDLVGAGSLEAMRGMRPPPDLRTAWPAAATGVDLQGRPLVVVCSVGVDLDLIPVAAEARLIDGRHGRLIVVLPRRDLHEVTRMVAGLLVEPAELVALDLAI